MRWMSLAGRNLAEVLRDPLSAGLGAAMPCALLALFAALGKNVPSPQFRIELMTPAYAVFSFAMLVMFSAMLLARDRSGGLFGRLLATPLEPRDFALAYALPFLPVAALQALTCYAVGAAFGAPLGAGAAVAAVALLPAALGFVGLGLCLGAIFTENQIAGLGSALVTAVGVFGGLYFDPAAAGGFFATIGKVLPFAAAVEAARLLFRGADLAAAAAPLLQTWAFAVLALGAGVLAIRARTRR
ncbi:MAG: ABC transporter permease [Spirochaetaceae bacterium]|nr:ABC transporter permease [Spirochaetaceae bacterium]